MFAAGPIGGLRPGRDGAPPRLSVNFFGRSVPMVRCRCTSPNTRAIGCETRTTRRCARFFDLFHHRMLMLFYRVWASGRPTVSHDRPATNRFQLYIGALAGMGLAALRERDDFPDAAKLFFAGRLAAHTRNAEGLEAIIGEFFAMPARIECFVGDWLELPVETAGGCPDGRAVDRWACRPSWGPTRGHARRNSGSSWGRSSANSDRCCRADPTCPS